MISTRNISTVALILLTTACASSATKSVDQKLATQEPTHTRADLKREASKLIESDADLSADQKQRLDILRSKVGSQLDDMGQQSMKLRSVLIEELLSPSYSADEVAEIKSRLKKIEDKRLAVIFDGVDQANTILGRQAQQHRGVMREMLYGRNILRD